MLGMKDLEDDDEELLDELPPMGLDEEEEGLSVAELGLAFEAGDESVGLDDSTGLESESGLFTLDLPPREATHEDDTEEEGIPLTEEIGGGDEYGWTVDAGSAADEKWNPGEVEMPKLTPLGRDDGGAEGVEEVFDLGGGGDDSAAHLPPLDRELGGAEDEEGDEGFELPAIWMDGPILTEEPALPPVLDECVVERRAEGRVRDFQLAGESLWVAGDRLVRDGVDLGLVATPLSLWIDGDVVLVGTGGGALRSVDRGETFATIEALGTDEIRIRAQSDGPLWACSTRGRLHKSVDGGASWSPPLLLTPVVALDTLSAGVAVLCVPERAGAQLARSVDGGERWAAVDAPALRREEGCRFSLACEGDDVAIASDADAGGPHVSTDGGRSWARVAGSPPAGVLAIRREVGGLAVYAAHAADGRSAVVRHVPGGGGEGGVLFECAGPVHRIVAPEDGTVWIACEEGLFRVVMGERP